MSCATSAGYDMGVISLTYRSDLYEATGQDYRCVTVTITFGSKAAHMDTGWMAEVV